MATKSIKRKLNNSNKKVGKVYSPTEVGVMLKSIDGKFDRIDGTIAQINASIGSLNGHIKRIDGSIVSLNGHIKRIDGSIDRLIDGQLKLDQKIDKLDEKLSAKIDALDDRIVSLERRMDSLENRMDSTEYEMKSGFKTIIDFIEAIDSETIDIKKKIENKIDKNEYIIIEQRVTKLEMEVCDCQKLIDAARKV